MPSDGKHFIEDNTCRWCLRALGLPWQITTTWWLKAAEMYSPAVYKARVQKWRCLRVADSLGEALRSQSMRILCRLVSPPLVVAHYPCIPWNVAAPLCLQAPSSLPLCLSCPSWSLMRPRAGCHSLGMPNISCVDPGILTFMLMQTPPPCKCHFGVCKCN